jgi:aspartate/methionine/tyrosine aminotransferase
MLKPALSINSVLKEMPEAASISINEMVYDLKRAGKDVITLSLGEAFFKIPLMDFSALDLAKSYHYSESRGVPELRRRLAGYYARNYGAQIDPDGEIIVSAGSKALVFMSIVAIATPGDEVLIHEPAWLSYPEHVRIARAVPRFIPFNCPVNDFKRYFTYKTKLLILCNPNNPAGRVYGVDELRMLYALCRSRGVYLLVDEAYSDFVLGDGFTSITRIVPDKDGIIAVNSLSKNMGISGWRIGYAISHADFIRQLLKLNQHIITCAPTILLLYCEKYFDELLSITLPQVRQVVEKRQRIRGALDEIGLKALAGGSTFYFFVSIGKYPGCSTEFALNLLKHRLVAVVPGSAYGESTDRFVRVSIGTESEERVRRGLMHLRQELEANGGVGERIIDGPAPVHHSETPS